MPSPAALLPSRSIVTAAPARTLQHLLLLLLLCLVSTVSQAAAPAATFTDPPSGVAWRGWAPNREVWALTTDATQEQAAQACRTQGGRLLSVLDEADQASIGALLSTPFWVGLSSTNPTFQPLWPNGNKWNGMATPTNNPVTIDGFPYDGATIADAPEPWCTALVTPLLHGKASGGMAAINCTARLPFVCGFAPVTNTDALKPYGDLVTLGGAPALVGRAPLTWPQARDFCAARGGQLLDLSSPDMWRLSFLLPSPLSPKAAGTGDQPLFWLGIRGCRQAGFNTGITCTWDGIARERPYPVSMPDGTNANAAAGNLVCRNQGTADLPQVCPCTWLDAGGMKWAMGQSCAATRKVLCEATAAPTATTPYTAYTALVDGYEYSLFPRPAKPTDAQSICAARGAALAPAGADMDAAVLTWLGNTWARGQPLLVDGSGAAAPAAPQSAARRALAAAAADECWVLGARHVNDTMLFVPGLLTRVACSKAAGAFVCRKEVSPTHTAGTNPSTSPLFITPTVTAAATPNGTDRGQAPSGAGGGDAGIVKKPVHKKHSSMPIGVIFAITFSAALALIAALTTPLLIARRRRAAADASSAPSTTKSKLSKGPGSFFSKFPLFRPLDTHNASSNSSAPIPHGRAPPTHSFPSTDPANHTHSTIDITNTFPFHTGDHPTPPAAASADAAAAAPPSTPRSPPSDSNILHVVLDMDPEKDLRVFRDQKLGHGAFGAVYRGEYFGVPVAVKTLDVLSMVGLSSSLAGSWSSSASTGASAEVAAIKQELEILSQVQHPNVVKLYGGCLTPPNVLIVMELMEYSLAEYIKRAGRRLPLKTSLQVVRAVAAGLTHLHPTIIHRDLKPQNILLDSSGNVKISDFGVSRVKMATYLTTQHQAAGTIPYMAPECYSDGPVTEKFDIYSLSMILWECLSGQSPWKDWTAVAIMYHVGCLKGRPTLPEDPEVCPPDVAALVNRCWSPDPSDRPSAADIVEEINRIEAALPDP